MPRGNSTAERPSGPRADVESAIRDVVVFLRRAREHMRGGQDWVATQMGALLPIMQSLERSTRSRPAAEVDEALLRELAGFLASDTFELRQLAFSTWCSLLNKNVTPAAAKSRALVLLGVPGAAKVVVDLLHCEVGYAASATHMTAVLSADADLLRALAASDPGALGTAVDALLAQLPQAAVDAVGLNVRASESAAWSPELALILLQLIELLEQLWPAAAMPGVEERSPALWDAVPALVAAMAAPQVDVALVATWAISGILLSSTDSSEALLRHGGQCLALAERGLLRGLTRCFEESLRRGRQRPHLQTEARLRLPGARPVETLLSPVAVLHCCTTHLFAKPKRLLDRPAAAWSAGAERLEAALRGLLDRAHALPLGDQGKARVEFAIVCMRRMRLWKTRSELLAAEAGTLTTVVVTTLAPAPAAAAPSSQRRRRGGRAQRPGTSVGGGAAADEQADEQPEGFLVRVLRRQCAVCCKTQADGAHLRRCRGCGNITGVMYCGQACAREHWVKKGHRAMCNARGCASCNVRCWKGTRKLCDVFCAL